MTAQPRGNTIMLTSMSSPERSEGTLSTATERLTKVFVLKMMGSKGISRFARDFGKSFSQRVL